MFSVIVCLFAGILVGYLLRRRNLRRVEASITILIWILVFLLGIEVGANRDVISALPRLGFDASLIAIAGVIGSAGFAGLLWRFSNRSIDSEANKEEKEGGSGER
ncbi:LysO family transporter [Porphyromonas gulae]|uniref:Membrane protein n=1 Tax=Porphyromonas gulae TaxID=111105 RepID=A0A0A2FEI1_9PORP|nr:LysO family transporter [Porphyromonas gulae]KGN88435.1 membrane protein [Porphyromonas gulae]KKC51444.1 membrane protein [Porphyromonas gulae]